jgi:protein SCO1
MKRFPWLLFLPLALVLSACRKEESSHAGGTNAPTAEAGSEAEEVPTTYEVKGVVRKINSDRNQLVVKHEEIPGFMAAMTMPFDVRPTNEMSKVKPGDRIAFRMLVTTNDGWIDSIRVIGKETNVVADPSPVRFVSAAKALVAGDLLPDYTLTNELGKTIRLADFRGKTLALTFIFTRCPYPDFCPRITDHFSRTLKKLNATPGASTNFHLLSVSFDPEHDSPELLLAYAERYAYDPRKWSLATGAWDQLEPLTAHFGLIFGRDVPPEKMEHNLRTVVIRPDGKVHAILNSNEWEVDELVQAIEAAGKAG